MALDKCVLENEFLIKKKKNAISNKTASFKC